MSDTRPCIVFCTTCKNRTAHLALTLPQNLRDNEDYPNAKFLVLNYGSEDNLLEYLRTTHAPDIDSGRLVVYSYPYTGAFRMAHAKNMAHRLGMLEGADVLCNLDADNFTGAGFALYIEEKLSTNADMFLWANRNQPAEVRYPKGCNGRIVVPADAFLKSGGYDEAKYNTWGPDDKDFHFRLRRFGYQACELPRRFLNVVLHNDKLRWVEYPQVKDDSKYVNFQVVDEMATIANWGQFGMGVVDKMIPASAPDQNMGIMDTITLGPLPTRIFGIGMHKTATTSLHQALTILGFDSAHWKSVRWAKHIWDEMQASGRSITLECHYALSDLPIPILYQELDRQYPGSKFILTYRNEDNWVKSVRYHWSKWNQFKDTWKKEDGFPRAIHKVVYGQEEFDAEVFLNVYRQHNRAVLDYFKGRPEDLLIMNMDDRAGWEGLCKFVEKPVPSQPYPNEYVKRGDVEREGWVVDEVKAEVEEVEVWAVPQAPFHSTTSPEKEQEKEQEHKHHHHKHHEEQKRQRRVSLALIVALVVLVVVLYVVFRLATR